MPTLSSALVKNEIASMREVEEALARQVLYGGDLATNLLELATVSEEALTRVVAEEHQLAAAPTGEIPTVPPEILSMVPGDVALRHGVYPLVARGGSLAVAVSEPLAPEVEEDLEFALGVRIEQRIAPLVRVRQAISRDYGLPLERRFFRLVAKLEGKPDPSPSSMPAMSKEAPDVSGLPRPPTVPPIAYPPATELDTAGPSSQLEPSTADSEHPPATKASAPPPGEPTDAHATAQPAAAEATSGMMPADPAPATVVEGPRTSRSGEKPRAASSSQQMPAVDRARWAATTKARSKKRPSLRPRHRGPYTAAMAEEDLLKAEERDQVLSAFFDFAHQYFEYSALFAVQSDIAEGRDSYGPGATPTQITGIGVPLELPSSLQRAKEQGTQPLVKLAGDGIDARLAKDLQRYVGGTVMLLPVHVRGRCVLILYGDDGRRPVDLSAVGEVIAFAPLVSRALERIILLKKHAARKAAGLPVGSLAPPVSKRLRRRAAPPPEDRAAALAAALDIKGADPLDDSDIPLPVEPASPQREAPAQDEPVPDSVIPQKTIDVGQAPEEAPAPAEAPARDPSMKELSSEAPPAPAPAPASTELPSFDAARMRRKVRPPTASAAPAPPASTEEPPEDGWEVVGTDPGVGGALEKMPPTTPERPTVPAKSGRRLELVAEEEEEESGAGTNDSPDISIGAAPLDEVLPPESEEDIQRDGEAPLAPGSRRIVVGPRRPRRRHSSKEMQLPSVIVDVESDFKPLVARLIEGDEAVEEKLMAGGAPAAAALVEKFPGPITAELARGTPHQPPRASECGPVLHVLAQIGEAAVPFVSVRTNDGDASVREWATRILGEMPAAAAGTAVAKRALDANAEVRRAAIDAARMLLSHDSAADALCEKLLENASQTDDHQTALSAIEAAAELRLRGAVPDLIELLGSKNAEIAQSALWALTIIARHDFGPDQAKWQDWWTGASGKHRVEWLIDALMHDAPEIRRAAGEELKSLTKEYFGYYDDLPKKERRRAQRRYEEWWETKGKARFH